MSALEGIRARRSEIRSIAEKHGAGNLRVFGSVARGDARPDSDVDLLIDIVGKTTPVVPGGPVGGLGEHPRPARGYCHCTIAPSVDPGVRSQGCRSAVKDDRK